MIEKTITFVRLEDTPFGGAENYLRRVVDELEKRNIRHKIFHTKTPKWLASWIRALWFNHEATKHKGQQFYFSLSRITCADIYRASDGVHKAYMKARGKKSLNPMHWVYLYLEKRCFAHAKRIIAISQFTRQEMIDYYQVDPNKINVIYNGINMPKYDAKKAKFELCHEFKKDPKLPTVLLVGNGFDRKGAGAFLRMIAKLELPVNAFIVGKDKHLSDYQQLAQSLGIADKVIFTGQRRDIDRFYAAADIFLYPALYEPFGNVILEALSFGCVVFASDKTGGGELLPKTHRITATNHAAILEQIRSLLVRPNKLKKAQQDAANIAKRYPVSKNVNETLKVIETVMGTS